MFDIFPSLDFNLRQVVIIIIALVGIYLIALVIPGIGVVVKHISHTITKYIIHPIVKYVFEAAIIWLFKTIWWAIKHLFFAFRVYFYHLTTSRKKVYPELSQKKIGVIDEETK